MEYLDLIIYLLAGTLAALLSGLIGIGGATIFVPVLLWVLPHRGIPDEKIIPMAFASSMLCVLILTGTSVWQHHKRGNICWSRVWRTIPFAIGGAAVGIFILFKLNPGGQKMAFAGFLAWMAWSMWRTRDHACPSQEARICWRKSAKKGSLTGVISGLVGIAGAVMLTAMMKGEIMFKRAIGTAAAISLPVAVVGVIGYGIGNARGDMNIISQQYDWFAVVGLTAPAFIFTRFGVGLATRMPVSKLKRIFSISTGVLALIVAYKAAM